MSHSQQLFCGADRREAQNALAFTTTGVPSFGQPRRKLQKLDIYGHLASSNCLLAWDLPPGIARFTSMRPGLDRREHQSCDLILTGVYETIPLTTSPWTSVSRKSLPA